QGHGALGLGDGEGGGEIEREQCDGGDQQTQHEGEAGDGAATPTGELESNARSRSRPLALCSLRGEGKDRGGTGTHIRTPVRSNVCATVARRSGDTQEEDRTCVWLPLRAALRWATGQRNREGPTDDARRP